MEAITPNSILKSCPKFQYFPNYYQKTHFEHFESIFRDLQNYRDSREAMLSRLLFLGNSLRLIH